MHTQRMTLAAALAAILLIGVGAGDGLIIGAAWAQEEEDSGPSEEDLETAREAYLEGAALIEEGELEDAVAAFKKSYRLSKNPLLLYNIGWTLDELDNEEMALFYYKKFAANAPEDAAQHEFVSDRIKEIERKTAADDIFSDDGKGKGKDNKGKGSEADEAPAAQVSGLQHKVVDAAPPGKPLDLTAFIPDEADWQVTLYYRGAGDAKFASANMRPRYNELVGRVPAAKLGGSSIQYYIEAKDKDGKVVERSGRATSPHLVLIDDTAAPRYYPDLTEERDWDAGSTARTTTPTGGTPGYGPGGWMDTGSRKFHYAKWGATGGAMGMLTLSVSFYLMASNASSSLEAEASLSRSEGCPTGNPCRAFSDHQKSLQASGERYQTLANVTFGLGVVAGAVAGYYWYKELKPGATDSGTTAARSTDSERRFTATPVAGPDYLGAAASLEF